jgi:integrase
MKERIKVVEYLEQKNDLKMLALFYIALNSGFRVSELMSLTVSDIYNNDRNESMEAVSVKKCNTKGKISGRNADISEETQRVVMEYIQNNLKMRDDFSTNLPLFPSRKKDKDGNIKNISRNQAWKLMCEIFREAGVDFNGMHGFRKSLAKDIYEETKDVMEVKSSLGHASLESTQNYLASFSSDKKKSIVGNMIKR